jgi:very-short-patch-repair endonuclease
MGAQLDDLTGKQFGEWTVQYYTGDKRWHCKCSCNTERDVLGSLLRSGKSKSCGCKKKEFNDLTGKQFGDWQVLYRNDNRTYMCRCSCGEEKIVQAYHLLHGKSKSCGHSTNKFEDLRGKHFGELIPIEYIGDRTWKCQCSCGSIINVKAQRLTHGKTRSCGCKTYELSKETLLNKYGDVVPARIKNPREQWQIDILSSKETLEAYILNKKIHNNKHVTVYELAEELGVTHSAILHRIEQFGIKEQVSLYSNTSRFERLILNNIRKHYHGEIVEHTRKVITPYELDIYIPEKNLAFEINGNIWHSDLYKDIEYHQQKTLACAKKGIQLIHIFEYEIVNNKEKILNFIEDLFNNNKKRIYARETIVECNHNNSEVQLFLDEYHIHGYIDAPINISLKYNNEIVGLASFSKPQSNREYQYELVRMCFKYDTIVVGGLEKMLHYFINNYNVASIVAYCDISKFKGNSYTRIGFNIIKDEPISKPNYIWCNDESNIKFRYTIQKDILIKKGFGTEEESEETIMRRLGYYKIYNSGNLGLELLTKN